MLLTIIRCEPCLRARLVHIFGELSKLTAPVCAACVYGGRQERCCDPYYCNQAIRHARKAWGVELTATGHRTLPLMGADGCTAPPHLRPTCTFHTCEIQSAGFRVGDEQWTRSYYELRQESELLLWQLKNQTGLELF